jgi:hypothetical protein
MIVKKVKRELEIRRSERIVGSTSPPGTIQLIAEIMFSFRQAPELYACGRMASSSRVLLIETILTNPRS